MTDKKEKAKVNEEQPKKIKFGVIGAGKIGTFHTRTLASMPEAELIGICDADSMKAQSLAWEYNCLAYDNFENLIPQVDALVVAVPTQFHEKVASVALEKGVHCLVEKPIASTMEEAIKLLELSKKKDILLQIGHSERFNPAVVEGFKHIKNPKFIIIERLGPYDPRMSEIGVVLDLMIHDIDLLLTMIDSPVVSFEAVGARVFSKHEDIANVRLKFENGCMAEVTASRASMERSRYMRVYQDNSYLSVDFMNIRVKKYEKTSAEIKNIKDIKVTYPEIKKQMPIHGELLHFIECIRTMKTPWPSAERGTKALELALAITHEIKLYNASYVKNPRGNNPIRVVSDIGKATQIAISETLKNIGLDKNNG